jgi:hypothetical protein
MRWEDIGPLIVLRMYELQMKVSKYIYDDLINDCFVIIWVDTIFNTLIYPIGELVAYFKPC